MFLSESRIIAEDKVEACSGALAHMGLSIRHFFVWLMAFLIGGLIWYTSTTELLTPISLPMLESSGFPDGILPYVAKSNASNAFRDNLRSEWNYVTTWNSAGMTNVLEGYVNLIYLALISERVAVVPPLVPSPTHMGETAPYLNLGEVYDLPELRAAIRSPVIEWADLKIARYGKQWTSGEKSPVTGVKLEELGCWSAGQITPGRMPHRTSLESFLQLDVAYRPVPPNAGLQDDVQHVRFWSLAYLLDPEGRQKALSTKNGETGKTLISKKTIAPDEQFGCFDDLYWAAAVTGYEWWHDISPAWRFVGRYLRFTKPLRALAEEILRRALGIEPGHATPPYVSVHVRRDDFKGVNRTCKYGEECDHLPPLSAYVKQVQEVQSLLYAKFGDSPKGNVTKVLVTSDEHDLDWWQEVRRLGWSYVNHTEEETTATFDIWQPALVDAVIQSGGIGLVGTHRSTMTRVAALRVRDWNGGIFKNVLW